LFALQAALGSGLLGYYLGLRRGQSRRNKQDRADAGD
ncbi:MAG: energy-coupling factor ABC transporter substrate-binding protein, partial [Candidatus Competibacter sp.]|nr:energy-coupling factor ABC transporter substrate-binding protein [Candidatus Competibacter sp.]